MTEHIEFRKIRDFGQVINDTFAFIRQNFKTLITSYFLFCGLFLAAAMFAMIIQQYKMVGMYNTNIAPAAGTRLSGLYNLEYFLAMFFNLMSYTSMTIVVHSYVAIYVKKGNQRPTYDEVWGYFKFYFWRVFGSTLALLVLAILSLICCIVPFFWLFPYISMIYAIMVVENGSLSYSFNRSFDLIKNNFWTTFGTLVIVWIIVYACTTVIVLPTSIFSIIGIAIQNGSKISLTLTMITAVLQTICQIFFIIPLITISFSYFSLVERKEHTGLLERIHQFGSQEQHPSDFRPEEY